MNEKIQLLLFMFTCYVGIPGRHSVRVKTRYRNKVQDKAYALYHKYMHRNYE